MMAIALRSSPRQEGTLSLGLLSRANLPRAVPNLAKPAARTRLEIVVLSQTIGQLQNTMERQAMRSVKVICASVTWLISLSYIDYLTGYQFLLFVLLLRAGRIVGWYLGRFAWFPWQSLAG